MYNIKLLLLKGGLYMIAHGDASVSMNSCLFFFDCIPYGKLSFWIFLIRRLFYSMIYVCVSKTKISALITNQKEKPKNKSTTSFIGRIDLCGAIFVSIKKKHLIKFTLNPDFEIRQNWTGLKLLIWKWNTNKSANCQLIFWMLFCYWQTYIKTPLNRLIHK